MSAPSNSGDGAAVTEDMVREYLVDHGDFLQRNPDLIDHLHIPHASGSAASLVERQVSVLRERNVDMRRRLSSLTHNARENDTLHQLTSDLVLGLLEACSLEALSSTLLEALRSKFRVEYATLILFGEVGFGRNLRIEDPATCRAQIGQLLRGGQPVCSALRADEMRYLFPGASSDGSAALMPLNRNGELGVLAVGSADPATYGPDMDTLFLNHIGQVILRLLPRLRASQAA